jgi:autotransporter-associated beta strand protein
MSSGIQSVTNKRFALTYQRRRALGLVAASAATLLMTRAANAGNGTWTDQTTGGLWSNTANWASGNIASGTDAVADFSTLALPASNTVHLNNSYTVGQLKFGDTNNANGWTLDNNGNFSNLLTLQTSSGAPVINVVNQSAVISASLSGTQGFTKTGAGILQFTGASTYTGVTNISNGTLVLGSSGTSSLAPAAGAVLDLDPNLSTVTTSSGVVTGVSDLSGNGNNATSSSVLSGPTLSTINGHKAFYFNGSAGLTDPLSSTLSNETVFAVINPTTVSGPSAIVGDNNSAGGGLELRLYQGKLQMLRERQAGYTQSTTSVPASTLSIVALSYNTSNGTYYVNGTSAGPTGSGNPALTGGGTLTVGDKSDSNSETFTGSIGTILIYNSVLSSADMATTENFLAQEYATSASTLGTTQVNLSSASSNLAIASSSQAVSSLAGVAGSNVYLGGGLLTVGSDGTSTSFAGNISDTGTGAVGTGGVLIKTGAGTLTLSGSLSNTGGTQVTAGTLLISGTAATSGPTIVTGGTLNVSGINATTGPNSVTGGTFNISGTNGATGNFSIGSAGTLALSGPSTATGSISFAGGGTLLLQANSSNVTGSGSSATSSAIGSPSGVVYANAATTNVQLRSDTSVTFLNSAPTGGTGSGAIINYDVNNVGGSSTAPNQTLTLGNTTGGTAGFATYQTTINVTGGNGYTMAIPAITDANNSYLNLNANTANLSVGSIYDIATLTVGGAQNTTISQITVNPYIGVGTLVKTGTGTLNLTGSNTYSGATNVSAGTLAIGSSGSLTATSSISIAKGATLDITANPSFALPSATTLLSGSGTINGSYNHGIGILSPGGNGAIGTLTINGTLGLTGGAVNLDINGSNTSTGGTTNDLIAVTGALNLVGTTTFNLSPVSPTLPSGTTWTVITYSGSAPTGTGTLAVSTSAFSVISVPGAIELKYNSGSVGTDIWTGSSSNSWDTSTPNFRPSGSTSAISYTDGDSVTFDDTSTVNVVNLAQTLSPSSVTVSSNTTNYNFSGSGSIAGSASLNKTGTSTLTISTANTYTGTSNISGGTVILTNTTGVGLGTGPLIIGVGATLQVGDGGADGAIPYSNTSSPILNNGTLAFNTSSAVNPPSTMTGTGSLYLNVLSIGIGNQNTFSGGTYIAGGQITSYESLSFGTGPVTVNGGTILMYYSGTLSGDYLNNFNLSGTAIHTGGSVTSTIGGTVVLAGDTTILQDSGSTLAFAQTITSTTNNNLILTAGGNGVIFEGNVSLGTGQIQAATTVQLSPPASTTMTISSAITGTGPVLQNAPGTTVLSASNTYSGNTTVSAGTLMLATTGSIASSGNVNVLSGGTLTLAASTSTIASALMPRTLGNVNISGGSVVLSPATNFANRQFVSVTGLSIATGTSGAFAGLLDIGNNSVDVEGAGTTGLATLTAAVKQGFNGGGWNGSAGIISASAAADSRHLTAVGIATGLTSFEGSTVGSTDVLIKYTYYGDANLDGAVDGSDYTLIDAGFNSQHSASPLTGWQNGDFNYDGVIDGSDYTLIDNAFNTQGSTLGTNPSALIASSTAQLSGGSSAVPEPATIGLLGFGAAGLSARRRRVR